MSGGRGWMVGNLLKSYLLYQVNSSSKKYLTETNKKKSKQTKSKPNKNLNKHINKQRNEFIGDPINI